MKSMDDDNQILTMMTFGMLKLSLLTYQFALPNAAKTEEISTVILFAPD
jgi:hypothetical protein